MQTSNKDFQIFVGFGGAGVKPITEMTALIRDNFKLGRTADRALCFLLVDTDTTELQGAVKKINENLRDFFRPGMPRNQGPMIRTLELGRPWARGLLFPQSIENRFYELERDVGESYEKYCESYWMRAPRRPFVFRDVVDPTQGASQMPLSSRIMAWWNAEALREEIDQLISDAILRNGGEGGRCDIYFINSLAGGTGRGVWSTLAFMLRDSLRRRNVRNTPIGIFLDATTFHDMPQEMQPRLRLNSLTGISELAMWLRNVRSGDNKARYVMLHPSNPDERLAVVDTMRRIEGTASEEASDRSSRSSLDGDPVDQACLIFGENQSGLKLKNKNEYSKQVGQVLYILLQDTQIRTKIINNENPEMFSLGAAVFSVPIDAVKDYMTERCKLAIIRAYLAANDLSKAAPDQNVAKKFIDLFGLSQEGRKNSDSNDSAIWDIWPMVARIPKNRAHSLYEASSLKALVTEEGGGKKQPSVWESAAEEVELLAFGDELLLEREVSRAYKAAFPDDKVAVDRINSSDFSVEFLVSRGIVRRIFGKSFVDAQRAAGVNTLQEKVQMLACAKEYFDSLVAILTKAESDRKWEVPALLAKKYPQTVTESLLDETGADAPGDDKASVVKAMVTERKGAGLWPFGSKEYFDSKERSEIGSGAEDAILRGLLTGYLSKVRKVFAAVTREMAQTQATLESLLKLVADEAESIEKHLESLATEAFIKDSSREACRLLPLQDPHNRLARYSVKVRCPWDDQVAQQIDAAITKQFEHSKNSDSAALSSIERLQEIFFDTAIVEASSVTDLLSSGSEEYSRFRSEVRMQLEVISNSIEVPSSFLEEEFSLARVLKRYVARASVDLKYLTGMAKEALREEYRTLLGVNLDEVDVIDLKGSDLVAHLACEVGSESQPWVKHIGTERTTMRCCVSVPRCSDKREGEMANIIKGRLADAEVFEVDSAPFAITAVQALIFPDLGTSSTEAAKSGKPDNFGGIVSVDYWRTSGRELMEMLQAAEKDEKDEPGQNLAIGGFKGNKLAARGGIGYLDPRFVKSSEPWSAIRWKPWAPLPTVRSSGLQQLLAYAVFLGNYAEATPEEKRARIAEVQARLREGGWEMPMLVREPDRRGLEGADHDWRWSRYVYIKDKFGKFHARGPGGATGLELKPGTSHRNLNDLYKKLNALSPELIDYFRLEMAEFKAKLKRLDLTNEHLELIRDNACELFGELEAEVEANFRNKDKATYALLKEFFLRPTLEAAFDTVLPLEP